MLLEDVKKIFAEEHIDRMPSQELVAKLVKMEDRPWIEWRNGKPITPRQIAKLLEQFKIAPRNIKLMGTVPKGYIAEDFADAFARYTVSEYATPLLSNDFNDLVPEKFATFSSAVADRNPGKSNDSNGGSGVADNKTSNGHVGDGLPGFIAADACEWCGRGPRSGDPLLPYLNGTGGNHLVHRCCHSGWLAARTRAREGRGPASFKVGDRSDADLRG
jgi:hypothetical protein